MTAFRGHGMAHIEVVVLRRLHRRFTNSVFYSNYIARYYNDKDSFSTYPGD